jgi:hypothetical protein
VGGCRTGEKKRSLTRKVQVRGTERCVGGEDEIGRREEGGREGE